MTLDVLADADEVAARAAKAAGVVVRELESLAELEAMTALFDEIWEPDAGNPSMRLDLLRAMTKAGNYASGAYDAASGALLGACVGFFGPPAHAELHSHIAGVVPAGLGRSVGFALKVHQRAWCLRRDVRVIAWTYDPLIRRNAYFNLVKLGARPVEYLRNFYGVMDDMINGGTETDRMLVHWDLRSVAASGASAGKPKARVVRRRAGARCGRGAPRRRRRPARAWSSACGRDSSPYLPATCRCARRHRGDAAVRPRAGGGLADRAAGRAVPACRERGAGDGL